jgi:branched-chain amino acid transport system substrate-binding protein
MAIDVLTRTKSLEPNAILDAVVTTNYNSMVGPVRWSGEPVKNVSKTPLVAGQWQRRDTSFELVITANKPAPEIPIGGKLELLS